MIFSDLDIWEQAFKEMKLNENVSFISKNGRLVTEEAEVEMYNKIQKLLNCDALETSHKWLYSLDPTELSESETNKINNLWRLGIDRGVIEDPTAETPDVDTTADIALDAAVSTEPTDEPEVKTEPAVTPSSAYTILYSAMRNGDIKTGEAYSNAVNPSSAKADVLSQLERAGYSNIKVLAIECGDPDNCGTDCQNTFVKQAEYDIPDYSGVAEDETEDEVTEADEDKDSDTDKESGKEDSEDKEESKDDESKEDEQKEEKAEEPDEKLKDDTEEKADDTSDAEAEDKELSAAEKTALKDSYKKAFKAAMLKCKFEEKAFEDLTLEEKVEFFTELSKAWTKADPSKFMSDKELDQLEKIVVKK